MLVFDIIYIMFQYLVVKLCSKFIIPEIVMVPKVYYFQFWLRKILFQTVVISLWKWESPVSNTLLFWKLRREFFRISSVHDGFPGFLKRFFVSLSFSGYVLMKSEIFFSLTWTLKSPSRIIFLSVQSLSKAALTLLRREAMFSLWWLYKHPRNHFLFLKFSSTKKPLNKNCLR